MLLMSQGVCAQDGDEAAEFTIDDEAMAAFEMAPEAEFETEVVAESPPDTAGEQSVSAEEISRQAPASTAEILTLSPGITVVQHGAEGKGHQLFLRGFDAAHGSDVEVRMDGISLNEPANVHGNGYLDLYGIIPEVILEMTVHKGPFLPFQGNFATGGTVDFELGVPSAYLGGVMKTELDSRGKLRAVSVVSDAGDARRFVALESVFDPGFSPHRKAGRATGMAKYRWHLGTGTTGDVLLNGQMADFQSPGAMPLQAVEQGEAGFYDSYGQAGAGRSRRLLFNAAFEKETAATNVSWQTFAIRRSFSLEENFTGYLLYPDEGDRRRQVHEAATLGANVTVSHKVAIAGPLWWQWGTGWRTDRISQAEYQVNEVGRIWQTNRDNRADLHHVHTFAGVTWAPFFWMHLQPSMRLDGALYDVSDMQPVQLREKQQFHWNVSPRATLSFPLHEKLTLFGSVGKGFRLPEARSVFAVEDVENEDVSQYTGGSAAVSNGTFVETGAQVSITSHLLMSATGYYTAMEKEMVFDHVSNTNLEKNETRRMGTEIRGEYAPLAWIRASADVSLVHAVFVASQHRVPGVPHWVANGRIGLGESMGPHGMFALRSVGKRTLAHGAAVNGYIDAELNSGWRFSHWDVTLAFENLFARKIMEGAYHFRSRFSEDAQESALPRIHYVAGNPFTVRLLLTVFIDTGGVE
ncbi:MAG: TonB-dependent receptor [Deltaproteobacteria bacterium]|nr:TonB-dependent receptor [Deltaproteobacteria bacterium]MBN2670782.1 TonB-dependent receptor [Deltaproteobacteria bacterium]